jgi:hypothetical protein
MITNLKSILPSGQGLILPPPTETEKIKVLARDCHFVLPDAIKNISALPKECTKSIPVNNRLTVWFNHRQYLFGVCKGIYRDGKLIAKGWAALFPPTTRKPETPASIIIIPGQAQNFIFDNFEDLNEFVFAAAKEISKEIAKNTPPPSPASPVPNYYGNSSFNFYQPNLGPNNMIRPVNMSGSLLY